MQNKFHDFLNQLDLNKNSNIIGKEYVDFVVDNQHIFNLFIDKNQPVFLDNQLLTIATDNGSMESITKRAILISETLALTFYSNNLREYLSRDERSKNKTDDSYATYRTDESLFATYGDWVKKTNILLKNDLAYILPKIEKKAVVEAYTGGYDGGWVSWDEVDYSIVDAIIQRNKVVTIQTSNIIKSKYIYPITEIELPFFENIDLNTYAKIVIDEKASFDIFKSFLQGKLLDIKDKYGSESYYQDLTKIGLELKNGINLLSREIYDIKTKRAFASTGAAVATTVATLVAIDSSAFQDLAKVIGTSGGAYLFFDIIQSQLLNSKRIKDSPFYFMWLLKKRGY